MPTVRDLNSRDCLYCWDWPLCSTPCPLASNINPPHPWYTWLKIRMLVWVRTLYIVLNEVLIIYVNDKINVQCTWKNVLKTVNMNFKITKKIWIFEKFRLNSTLGSKVNFIWKNGNWRDLCRKPGDSCFIWEISG